MLKIAVHCNYIIKSGFICYFSAKGMTSVLNVTLF